MRYFRSSSRTTPGHCGVSSSRGSGSINMAEAAIRVSLSCLLRQCQALIEIESLTRVHVPMYPHSSAMFSGARSKQSTDILAGFLRCAKDTTATTRWRSQLTGRSGTRDAWEMLRRRQQRLSTVPLSPPLQLWQQERQQQRSTVPPPPPLRLRRQQR